MRKPRIAVVADVRNWAFSNIASQMEKNLNQKYQISILYLEDYPKRPELYSALFCGQPFDLVHFLWRETALTCDIMLPFLEDGFDEAYTEGFLNTAITSSVYDHLFLAPEEIKARTFSYKYLLDGYTVSSQKLFDIYRDIEEYPEPDAVIEDGVDPTHFFPKDLDRLGEQGRELVIGWVGNSRWGMEQGTDRKGLYTVIKPALEAFRGENVPIKGLFADRNERFIPREEMVDYYSGIDVLVCASDAEGTPNPVLEAMACGVPVVSTDVGIVPQVFGAIQSRFIMEERNPEALKSKLKSLLGDPELRLALSEENLSRIRLWTREQESLKWDCFFEKILKRHAEGRRRMFEPSMKGAFKAFMLEHRKALTGLIEEKEKAMRSLTRMIDERDEAMRSMTRMIDERDDAMRSMTKMIDDRDALIKRHEAQPYGRVLLSLPFGRGRWLSFAVKFMRGSPWRSRL